MTQKKPLGPGDALFDFGVIGIWVAYHVLCVAVVGLIVSLTSAQ
ncbi:hypothetical protein SEA_SHARKBOY_26 [Microbacterium phage Sharkboy]|uniref:Uncharacterized protein n=1 Tax=Microbacterium phage Sharkboy TaxID=2590938 RepID=A0A516KUA1_9CAUD|nr:hypothetical protein SEA_SHARKBOY_26 [Microbacterium phage Sharkboy]